MRLACRFLLWALGLILLTARGLNAEPVEVTFMVAPSDQARAVWQKVR